MKTKRYSTEQIIGILKETENGLPVKELCRMHCAAMKRFTTGNRNSAA
jgi:hypothetical protein